MKLYNVHLEISLLEIGDDIEAIRPPNAESITEDLKAAGVATDSPFGELGKTFDVLQKRGIFPGATPGGPLVVPAGFPGGGDSMNMHHNFKMVGDFKELQNVLAKFRELAESFSLPKV